CWKAMPPKFASAPIRPAVSSSATSLALTSAAGARWRSAAIATKSPASPAGAFPAPPQQRPGPDSQARQSLRRRRQRLHILGGLALGPRIIRVREYQPIRERRMRIEPERNQRRRIRIGQTNFPQNLEGVRRDLRRIRNDAVDYFEPVYIGVVFLHATVAIFDGHRDEHQHLENQKHAR